MEKEIQIELSAESEVGSGYYYASLELPASREQIRDAQQKARWTDSTTQLRTIGVTSCAVIPNLVFARLDTTSIDEMNFLAHRLESMDASERLIYHGLYQHLCKDEEFADPLSVNDLINMTYGLDSVMVASNVTNLKELGQFVIDNELNENVNAIPEDSVYLIDLEKLGRLQQSVDSGIFIGNLYIVAGDFEMPQVYDGVNLPEMPEVQGIPEIIEKLAEYAGSQEEADELTKRYAEMTDDHQMLFKAVLEAEDINSASVALERMDQLHRYTLAHFESEPDTFFKEYLLHHLDTRFDPKWLDTMVAGIEGQTLLERLGAKQTSYGILSAPGHPLFELVTHDAPKGVQQIDVHEIRSLNAMDGIIFQGCGGNLQEWVDGLNQLMTQEGILRNGTQLTEAYTFNHEGLTNLLFPFKEGMDIDFGRFAMWRLATHEQFGGTWLSDYISNRLDADIEEPMDEPQEMSQ